jgi:hypothetical protein
MTVQQGFETIEPIAPEGATQTYSFEQRCEASQRGAEMSLDSIAAGERRPTSATRTVADAMSIKTYNLSDMN